MPWVAAFRGEVLMSVGRLTVQVCVDIGAINDDYGVQKRGAFFGPLRCKFDGWVEFVDFL